MGRQELAVCVAGILQRQVQLEDREGFKRPQRLESAPGANPVVGDWGIASSER